MRLSRSFDTHASTAAATQLSKYLQQVNHGQVIVGVTSHDARLRLDNALPTLQEFGVEVSDVQYRGSFGFVAQKGFPSKTALRKALTEEDSNRNPPRLNAIIAGIQTVL